MDNCHRDREGMATGKGWMESGKPLTEEDVQQCTVKVQSSREKYTHIAFCGDHDIGRGH